MKKEGKGEDERQEVQNSLDTSHALALSLGYNAEKGGKGRMAMKWYHLAGGIAVLAAIWRASV